MRKILSFVLMFALIISSFVVPVHASSTEEITIDGQVYQISQDIIDEKLQVTVIGNGETIIVTNNNDNTLTIDTLDDRTRSIASSYTVSMEAEPVSKEYLSRASHSTPFWNYYYYYGSQSSNYGTYWSLTSGKSNGSKSGYDYNDSNSRNYAENFMRDVQGITNNQAAAIAASGVAVAGAIAAALSAPSGIGAIAGIVVAAGGAIGTVGYWTAAYTGSLAANYNFNRVVLK